MLSLRAPGDRSGCPAHRGARPRGEVWEAAATLELFPQKRHDPGKTPGFRSIATQTPTPHEILLCNNGQEEIRTAEILTPVDFIWAPSRSILKESNGIVERAPED